MIRRPLRPLAKILRARETGGDPNLIEAEERAARLAESFRAERKRAEIRLVLLGLAFLIGYSTIIARMALVSAAVPEEPQTARAANPIRAERADIVDRNGIVLATNVLTSSLYAQPQEMVDPVAAAEGLVAIFPDLDAADLKKRFTSGAKFLWIKKSISPEQMQLVHQIGEPGLLFGPRETRLYPNGPVAAHILGGTRFGREGVSAAEVIGMAGVESVFDTRLRDPEQIGEPLRLSIDLGAQIALEEVLSNGMVEMNAVGAAGILMEADTGQIRAMASLPEFDPNDRSGQLDQRDPANSPFFNRAAQGLYELGSTFKPLTVALALETGMVNPKTQIDTRGPMKWGRFTINDFHNYGPSLSVEEVIVQSSNIGSARIAIEQGTAAQKRFLAQVGMMEPIPVELSEAARTKPLLPQRWSDLATMTISYGHGIAVTPLHLATAYASLTNGGYRVKPSVIETPNISKTDGEVIISELTSRQVRDMMRQVVVRGTAKFANVEGYEIAGKTGTADKPLPGGGYASNKVIATMASVFPASNPKYVLIIILDEPERIYNGQKLRTAGWTAAPVMANAVRRIAPVLGMRPQNSGKPEAPVLYTLAGNE